MLEVSTCRNGEDWYKIRSQAQQSMMKPKSALLYLQPMEEVAKEFVERMKLIRDSNGELPADFINELYKWGLECEVHWCFVLLVESLISNEKKNNMPKR